MSSPHRPLNPRSGLVLDTHELGRRAGAMKVVRASVEAPADLGISVIGVPLGSPIELDLRLESVVEGVLVSGSATVEVRGECVRCLGEISDEMEVDIQELYVYPGVEPDDALARATSLTLSRWSATKWCLICHSSPCVGMTAWDCASNAAPTSTKILTTAMQRVSTLDGMPCAALRVETANLTMCYRLPHGQ